MFRRKGRGENDSDGVADEVTETTDGTDPAADSVDVVEPSLAEVPDGPYDVREVPPSEVSRVDLGGIRIAGFTDLQLHLEPDPSGARIVSVVAAFQDAALRLPTRG